MERTKVFDYKGKTIYYMDFSGLKSQEEIMDLINVGKNFIRVQKEKSILTLSNIDKMYYNGDIMKIFSDFMSGNRFYVISGAVVGLPSLKRIIYNGILKISGRDVRTFDKMENAKEWLVTVELEEEEVVAF